MLELLSSQISESHIQLILGCLDDGVMPYGVKCVETVLRSPKYCENVIREKFPVGDINLLIGDGSTIEVWVDNKFTHHTMNMYDENLYITRSTTRRRNDRDYFIVSLN